MERNPDLVCTFYDERRQEAARAKPNAAHIALAALEAHWAAEGKGSFLLVTQNVDDLHERAGSRQVLHMHGSLNAASCIECGWHGPRYGRVEDNRECGICGREALRPDIVLFGEAPRHMGQIEAALRTCDLFVAIGTSGTVYPAAGFAEIAKAHRAVTHRFDVTKPDSTIFDTHHVGPASQSVPGWVDELTGIKRSG